MSQTSPKASPESRRGDCPSLGGLQQGPRGEGLWGAGTDGHGNFGKHCLPVRPFTCLRLQVCSPEKGDGTAPASRHVRSVWDSGDAGGSVYSGPRHSAQPGGWALASRRGARTSVTAGLEEAEQAVPLCAQCPHGDRVDNGSSVLRAAGQEGRTQPGARPGAQLCRLPCPSWETLLCHGCSWGAAGTQ